MRSFLRTCTVDHRWMATRPAQGGVSVGLLEHYSKVELDSKLQIAIVLHRAISCLLAVV